jgi:hypothetical protein
VEEAVKADDLEAGPRLPPTKIPNEKQPEPLESAFFMGFTYDLITTTKVGPLNPDWVQQFFKGVYIQLFMFKPRHWWPTVVGKGRK